MVSTPNLQRLRLRAKRFGETSPELADDSRGKRRRAIPKPDGSKPSGERPGEQLVWHDFQRVAPRITLEVGNWKLGIVA